MSSHHPPFLTKMVSIPMVPRKMRLKFTWRADVNSEFYGSEFTSSESPWNSVALSIGSLLIRDAGAMIRCRSASGYHR